MTTEIYLFNVDRGQCLAIRGDSGKWYIFDLGCCDAFSPLDWITEKYGPDISIEELTLSHYHGDHLGDIAKISNLEVSNLNHVEHDAMYITDCYSSNSQESHHLLRNAIRYAYNFNHSSLYDDDKEIEIIHKALPMSEVQEIGGSYNNRVNNSSIVSRINLSCLSILVCGDMEKSGWSHIFNKSWYARSKWKSIVKNIDILIAPHHGHSSGYSVDLMRTANPSVVLASVASKNPHVEGRYSDHQFVKGWDIGGETKKLLTTRNDGHIKIIHRDGWLKDSLSFAAGDQSLI